MARGDGDRESSAVIRIDCTDADGPCLGNMTRSPEAARMALERRQNRADDALSRL